MRLGLAALLVVCACFADNTPAGEGGSTGTACTTGSEGCPCYGNMTCDGQLACTDGYCVDPQCVPGTENCPCLPSGGCDVGLVCDGVCKPPASTTSADASATSTDPSATAGESGMSTTTDSNTGPLTSGMEVGPTSVSDTTPSCPGCLAGTFCFEGQCVDAAPYTPCADCMSSCLDGLSGENVCALDCDPQGVACPGVTGLPPTICFDDDTDGAGNCVTVCTTEPCPPEMICVELSGNLVVSVCMWQ